MLCFTQFSAASAHERRFPMTFQMNYPPRKTVIAAFVAVLTFAIALGGGVIAYLRHERPIEAPVSGGLTIAPKPTLDKAEYDRRLLQLAHVRPVEATTAPEGGQEKPRLWPVKAAYPEYGAILPFKRIVAYYGNFYSKGMGVLGEYPEEEMLAKLKAEAGAWEAADPTMPVLPAIDFIAVTAQRDAGDDGKYRIRMPDSQIDKALAIAAKVDGIVILEVQAGTADLMTEIRALEPYLGKPQVHLAIDPEFAMKSGARPGSVVGTVDAADVNAAAAYLAELVRKNGLPPKVLIVHRYTRAMVTHATQIVPLPEVQIVMDMDGWGPPAKKFSTYDAYIEPEPVQFTGFKLFYKNDIKRPGSRLLTPAEVLELAPQPSFIQYQ